MYNSEVSDKPAVTASVVVPNLNGAAYLPETLASLEAQGDPELEVIVVDGGSTDGSLEIARDWLAARRNGLLIAEPDTGQANAINKGFRRATGEIVGWLNSDDLLTTGSLERASTAFAADPGVDFVWGFCLCIAPPGAPRYIINPFVRRDFSALRSHMNFVPQPGTWMRRSVLDRFGYLDESYHYSFDYEYFLRICTGVTAEFIPEVLAEFRLHPGSKTSRAQREFFREDWRAYRAHHGPILAPFTINYVRRRWLEPAADVVKWPFRRLVWRLTGAQPGERIRD